MGCLERLIGEGLHAIEVRQAAHDAYNERLQAQMAKMVWSHPSIRHSWYRNDAGEIYILSPWRLVDYWHGPRHPTPPTSTWPEPTVSPTTDGRYRLAMSLDVAATIDRLRVTFDSGRTADLGWRKRQLQGVIDLVKQNEQQLCDAMAADLGKPPFDAWLTELNLVKEEASTPSGT